MVEFLLELFGEFLFEIFCHMLDSCLQELIRCIRDVI